MTRPAVNARGRPWSSIGQRNLGCIGTRLGNGGVTPPGRYERRKGTIGSVEGRRKDWRGWWRNDVFTAVRDGVIDATAAMVAMALADRSSSTGELVWPSHASIGRSVHRCRRTVAVALAALRRAGLVEWDHRTALDGQGRPTQSSNLYRLTLTPGSQSELAERRERALQRRTTERKGHGRVTPATFAPRVASPVFAGWADPAAQEAAVQEAHTLVRTAADRAEGRRRLEERYAAEPAVLRVALDEYDQHWLMWRGVVQRE